MFGLVLVRFLQIKQSVWICSFCIFLRLWATFASLPVWVSSTLVSIYHTMKHMRSVIKQASALSDSNECVYSWGFVYSGAGGVRRTHTNGHKGSFCSPCHWNWNSSAWSSWINAPLIAHRVSFKHTHICIHIHTCIHTYMWSLAEVAVYLENRLLHKSEKTKT